MKTKLLFTSILLASMLAVTSCSPASGNSSHNTGLNPDPAKPQMVYKNPTKAKPAQSGGGFDINPKNTTDVKLNYNYDDLGDIRAYFGAVPGSPNFEYKYIPGANALDYMPSTGDVNLLVIPVKLADYEEDPNDLNHSKQIRDQKREDIYKAYFGTKEDTGGYESVRTYFEKSSFGSLQISGVVSDWYYTDYTTNIGLDGTSANAVADLTGKAFDWYKQTYNTNGAEFDSDHDGYVDAICLIYNAPAKYNNVPNSELWAYCFWRTSKPGTAEKPNANAFFWASTSFLESETNDDIVLDTHTYIHELGHVMGLDDYYNYWDQRNGCTGGYIMEDMNIGDHDPFSKMALNWVTPTIVTGSTTIELSSFTETGQVLIFKPNTNGFDSPFDEYLAVELYTPTGLNEYDTDHLFGRGFIRGPKASGLRIWHVDGRLLRFDSKGNSIVTNRYEKGSSEYDYVVANTNTNNGPYASKNIDFRDFRLIQSIQAGTINTYQNGHFLTSSDLFQKGDWFNMGTYSNFFSKRGKFNSGETLDIQIDVVDIKNNVATLEVTM